MTALTVVLITCATLTVVDGDTVKCDGENLRLLGDGIPNKYGVDTPEIWKAKCEEELHMADLAKVRLEELVKTSGLLIEDSGEKGSWGRRLVRLRLPNGETIGQTMIDEKFAGVWRKGQKIDWCDGQGG